MLSLLGMRLGSPSASPSLPSQKLVCLSTLGNYCLSRPQGPSLTAHARKLQN